MKLMLAAMTAALMSTVLVAGTVFATPPTGNLMTQAWRIQYINPGTSFLWDIDKVKLDAADDLTFPIDQFVTTTTGSFAVYFQNNYNTDLTETQTLTATASWTPGLYVTRGPASDGAYGRFWFQSAIGNWNFNDYWWYSPSSLDLNDGSTGTMTAALSDRAGWSNICGGVAIDDSVWTGPDCVGGTYPAVSPSDGFDAAMENVKQIGISFGRASSYASGIALVGADGEFSMSAFDVITTP